MNETPANEALALLDERKATVLRVRFYEGRTLECLAVQLLRSDFFQIQCFY